MLAFLNKYKGYIISAIASGVLVLDPQQVVALISAHPQYAGLGLLAWSWLLHWAQGRKAPAPVKQ